MRDNSDIALLLLVGVGLVAISGTASAAFAWPSLFGGGADVWAGWNNALPDGIDPVPVNPTYDATGDTIMPSTGADLETKIAAFLETVGQFESKGDYTVLYGGGHFSDFSHHPNVRVPITMGKYAGQVSTAAGKYQINFPTYQHYAPLVGVSDFSPASQDALAYAILSDTDAPAYLDQDDIQGALAAASGKWASLPFSTAGQHPQSLQVALDTYQAALVA